VEVIARHPGPGLDPLMKKYRCLDCGCKFWVAPAVTYKDKEKE